MPVPTAGPARFRFACQRSGRCCTHGEGYVFVDAKELAELAGELGLSVAAFRQRNVREVVDPKSGELRMSLRADLGRCALLEGQNECSVYAARPRQCRSFPRWPVLFADRDAFARTRAMCPGMAVVVEHAQLERAGSALADFLDQEAPVEASLPCPFRDAGQNVHATGLEIDWALADPSVYAAAISAAPLPTGTGPCPFHKPAGQVGDHAGEPGTCRAGARRPLACRPQREPEARDQAYRQLRGLEAELDYPAALGPLARLVASRLSAIVTHPSHPVRSAQTAEEA